MEAESSNYLIQTNHICSKCKEFKYSHLARSYSIAGVWLSPPQVDLLGLVYCFVTKKLPYYCENCMKLFYIKNSESFINNTMVIFELLISKITNPTRNLRG